MSLQISNSNKVSGTVFDIQGFSVHDGPGTRTVIFMNGCPLFCKWCSNPEGRFFRPVPMYSAVKCARDGDCIKACRSRAVKINDGQLTIDRERCALCTSYDCVNACCSGALRIAGYEISLEDIIKILKRDRFYWGSNGGVTLTGGEPFAQPEFTRRIFEFCRDNFIHTAVETCGFVPEENFLGTLPLIDWMFFDIKHMDSQKHFEGTGADNALILKNLKMISERYEGELVIRMVLIPGYNDSDDHILKLAGFISSLPLKKRVVNFLPVHHLAREKYNMLGMKYYTRNIEFVTQSVIDRIKGIMTAHGIECCIGSDTPF